MPGSYDLWESGCCEFDGRCVAAADKHADALAGLRLVAMRDERCECRSASRFGGQAKRLPKGELGLLDSVVGHENDLLNKALGDGEHEFADAFGRERIGGDSAGRAVDGMARAQGLRERGREFRFDTDDVDTARVPGGDAADKSTATDGDQQSVEVGELLFEFESDRALAEERFDLIVGVNSQSTGFGAPGFAGGEGVSVAFSGDD